MATYYVASGGSNSNSGTSTSAPWLTLAYAMAQLDPGDTLFIRGGANYAARVVWTEALSIFASTGFQAGTAVNPIFIRNYPGEFIELQNSTGTPFYLRGLDYWRIIGTDADGDDAYADEANKDDSDSAYYINVNCNDKTSSGYGLRIRESNYFEGRYINVRNGAYFTMVIFDDCDYCWLYNCRVGDNFIGPGSDAAGVQFQSNATDNFGGGVDTCYFYDCGSDGVVMDLPADGLSTTMWSGLTVTRSYFAAWSTAGKSEQGVDFKAAENCIVEYCDFTGFTYNDGSVSGSGGGGSACLAIHSNSRTGNIVRLNTFRNSSGRAVWMGAPGSLVYRNRVYDFTDEAAVSSGGRNFFYFASASGSATHYLVNNTAIEKHGGSGSGTYIRLLTGVTVIGYNNVFYDCEDVDIAGTFTHSYSCYFSCTQTPSGGSNNITTDPAFEDAASDDYRLSSTSPCINTGTVYSPVTDGFYGSAPDMGYFERGAFAQAAFGSFPSTGTSGTPLTTFTVTAQQFDGETATSYTGNFTVSIETGSGSVSGTLTVAAVAGVSTFSAVTLVGSGDFTLDGTGSGISATSGTVTISGASTGGGGGGGVDLLNVARFENITFTTNEHGFASLNAFIPLNLEDAFQLYDRAGVPDFRLVDNGATVWHGRLEDVALVNGGVNVGFLGYIRALTDIPYTALWTSTRHDEWREVTSDDRTGRDPSKYEIQVANKNGVSELQIGLKKNEVYLLNDDIGALTFVKPANSFRFIQTFAFDYEVLLPSGLFRFRITTSSDDFSSPTDINDLNGTGALQVGSLCLTFSECDRLQVMIYNYNSASYTYTGGTGDNYLAIKNLRVTTNALAVNTTLASSASAGATSISVTSASGIIEGMYLYLGGTTPERVLVSGISGTTITVSALGTAKSSGATVRAQAVYADEIIDHMVNTSYGVNSAQVDSTALVENPGLDLNDESYEDENMIDILNRLCLKGDDEDTPNIWEAGIYDNKALHFRPRGRDGRTWYVDISDLNIQRTIEQLYNSTYPVYNDAGGRTIRGAATADSSSVSRYGITRRQPVKVSTTQSTQAEWQSGLVLSDRKNPTPRARLTLRAEDGIFDASGTRWEKYFVRAGDIVVMRNLPTTLSASIDKIRTFRVKETSYSVSNDELSLTPETPTPSLDFYIARKDDNALSG